MNGVMCAGGMHSCSGPMGFPELYEWQSLWEKLSGAPSLCMSHTNMPLSPNAIEKEAKVRSARAEKLLGRDETRSEEGEEGGEAKAASARGSWHMAITNRITVSSFRKERLRKNGNRCVHIVSFGFLFFLSVCFSHWTISHSDNEEKGEKIYSHVSFVQKTTYTGHAALGKEIKARQRIQKYRKISSHLFTETHRPPSIAPPRKGHFRNILSARPSSPLLPCHCFYSVLFFSLNNKTTKVRYPHPPSLPPWTCVQPGRPACLSDRKLVG